MNGFSREAEDIEASREKAWMERTHTVTDPAGEITVTCDRDRRVVELGISEEARARGEIELQQRLSRLMQLAFDKAGMGLRRELRERNPDAPTSLLAGFTLSAEDYTQKEREAFAERSDR